MSSAISTQSLSAVGQTVGIELVGGFNITLSGVFVATIQLERSFDKGATWVPVSKDATGAVMAFTTPASLSGFEYESGVQYRFNCTAFTSGTAACRLSR